MKNNRVTVQFDEEVASLIMGDKEALGTSGSSTVNLIVKQYYKNGKTFRSKEQDDQIELLNKEVEHLKKKALQDKSESNVKVKELEVKLETKSKELAAANKNLKGHADRLDKQYKQIAEQKKQLTAKPKVDNDLKATLDKQKKEIDALKVIKERLMASIEKRDARYHKIHNEACHYAREVKNERLAIVQYCYKLDGLIDEASSAKIPVEIIEGLKDLCESLSDHKEVRLANCDFSANGAGR